MQVKNVQDLVILVTLDERCLGILAFYIKIRLLCSYFPMNLALSFQKITREI